MEITRFNPVSGVLNLVIGWFVMALLQAAAISLFSGGWSHLWERFLGIALFRNGSGVVINFIAIIAIGGGVILLWLRSRR
jgi:hypothetical protein